MSPATVVADRSRVRRLASTLGMLAFLAALTALLVPIPRPGDPGHLDCGWCGMLFFDAAANARAGVDQVFTYGPLGWLLADTMFSAAGLGEIWLAKLLATAVLAWALLRPLASLPDWRWRAAWLFVLGPLAIWLSPGAHFAALAALGIDLLRRPTLRPSDVCALLAIAGAALLKFTFCVQGVATVGVVALALLLAGRRRTAAAIAGAFALAFVFAWWLADQALTDLPAWWRGATEIAVGYQDVMGLAGEPHDLAWALGFTAGNALLAALLWRQRRGERRARAAADVAKVSGWPSIGANAIVLLATWVTWKAAFVRHDPGHAPMYFGFLVLLPFLVLAAAAVTTVPRPAGLLLLGLVGSSTLYQHRLLSTSGQWNSLEIAHLHWAAATRPGPGIRYLTELLEQAFATPALPRLRQQVGAAPVDLLGNEQGLLLASGFAIDHRPVFQSYSAYTPYLQQLNAAHFRAESAPAFVLAKVHAINRQPPFAADSQAWLEVLHGYRPVGAERGVALLQRRPLPARPQLAVVAEQRIAWGRWVPIPRAPAWHTLALSIDRTLLGRLVAAALRPGDLYLELQVDGEPAPRTFRIATQLVQQPFVIDPPIATTADLLRAWRGEDLPRAAAFRIGVEPSAASQYRGDGADATLAAFDPPGRALDAAELRAIDAALAALPN